MIFMFKGLRSTKLQERAEAARDVVARLKLQGFYEPKLSYVDKLSKQHDALDDNNTTHALISLRDGRGPYRRIEITVPKFWGGKPIVTYYYTANKKELAVSADTIARALKDAGGYLIMPYVESDRHEIVF